MTSTLNATSSSSSFHGLPLWLNPGPMPYSPLQIFSPNSMNSTVRNENPLAPTSREARSDSADTFANSSSCNKAFSRPTITLPKGRRQLFSPHRLILIISGIIAIGTACLFISGWLRYTESTTLPITIAATVSCFLALASLRLALRAHSEERRHAMKMASHRLGLTYSPTVNETTIAALGSFGDGITTNWDRVEDETFCHTPTRMSVYWRTHLGRQNISWYEGLLSFSQPVIADEITVQPRSLVSRTLLRHFDRHHTDAFDPLYLFKQAFQVCGSGSIDGLPSTLARRHELIDYLLQNRLWQFDICWRHLRVRKRTPWGWQTWTSVQPSRLSPKDTVDRDVTEIWTALSQLERSLA